MNGGINVRQDDILWRFYCKRFTVEGKEVEAPKNLCRYFWTSVNGFGLWLGREVKLGSLWLFVLVATALFFATALAIPKTDNIVVTALVVTVVVVWYFAFMLASLVTLIRAKRMVEARAPWVMYLLGVCFVAFAVAYAITPETFGSDFQQLFGYMFRWMGYMLIVMVSMIIIMLVISRIPHHRLQKLRRAFQTLGAFLSAKKRRMCPPVNPPEEFETKQ